MKLYPIAALLLALPFATAAEDDVHPELGAKYSLDLGLFFPERDIVLQAGATGLRGVDFVSEFGLEKHDQTFAIDFRWRFGETSLSRSNPRMPPASSSLRSLRDIAVCKKMRS